MPVLYVTQPGADVRKKGARLQVKWQGNVLVALPLQSVERIVLLGPAQVSAAATRALLRSGIPVIFCNSRGRFYGMLSTGCEDVELLLSQVERYRDEAFRLNVARNVVAAKIRHQQRLLQRHARNHPNPSLTYTVDQLEVLLETLSRRGSVPEVMGVEGQASALYFSALGLCIRRDGITFAGRNRHPPKDPVNAVLSLGYMLVLGEVVSALAAHGLHPGIGFLHEAGNRRPALALDVLEVARQPIVDRLALSLFNLGVLTPEDFHKRGDEEVRLGERSLRRYLQYYERAMTTHFRNGKGGKPTTFREWLSMQARELKESILAKSLWRPAVLEL